MKILVTGGCGFIGSHLVEYLQRQGHSVNVLDNLSGGATVLWTGQVWVADCQNRNALLHAAEGCDYIYHCASTVGVQKVLRDPASCIRNIIDSTTSVLSLGVPGMYFSTSEVYGMHEMEVFYPFAETTPCILSGAPRWSYAAAKLTGEWLALDAGWQVVRLFNVVGPRQNPAYGAVMPRFVQAALEGRPLEVYGDGTQVRTFTSVYDVIRILDGLRSQAFDVLNVGGDQSISIRELAARVRVLTESQSEITYVPYEKAYPAGFEECPSRVPDLTKLESILGKQEYRSLDLIIKEMEKQYGQTIRKRQHDPVANLS